MKKTKEPKEYNRAFFVAKGKQGGLATKKKYGKRHFKKLRALPRKVKSSRKGLCISQSCNNPLVGVI